MVSVGAGLHPPWTRPPAPERRPERYRFSRISWTLDEAGSRHVPRRRDEVPRRDDVVYYFGARLDAAHAPQVYAGLASSGFPSLYAATSPGDDFAESFASYVHVVLMRKPWEVRILRGGELLVRLGSCWHEARCAAKRRQLENLLHGPPAGHRTAPD